MSKVKFALIWAMGFLGFCLIVGVTWGLAWLLTPEVVFVSILIFVALYGSYQIADVVRFKMDRKAEEDET